MANSLRCLIDSTLSGKTLLDSIKKRYKSSVNYDSQSFNGELSGTLEFKNNDEVTVIYFLYSKPFGKLLDGLKFEASEILGMIADISGFSETLFNELLNDYGGYLLDDRRHSDYQRFTPDNLLAYDDFQR